MQVDGTILYDLESNWQLAGRQAAGRRKQTVRLGVELAGSGKEGSR